MIEFSGCLSYKCQKYILRKESRVGFIAGLITAIIFSIPTVLLAIKVHFIFIVGIPTLLSIAFLAGMPPSKKTYNTILPSKITIDPINGTIISESEKFYLKRSISDIVFIQDMGEWYHIYFGEKIDKLGRFVCQKDLIHGCTIGEFEKIFDKKIVRK